MEIEFQTWKIQNPVFSENWVSNVKIQIPGFSENWWEKVCNVYHFTFKIHTTGPMIEEEIGTFPIGSHYSLNQKNVSSNQQDFQCYCFQGFSVDIWISLLRTVVW